ncbi:MAG TPA: hypothetical protein VG010_02040 [Solirubrobacteraceae bacterium]|jgi:Sec-independent protein translocase protein TatA|nr:hypothetical protein [Solirubrobacteraceae bacterium]
MAHARKGSPLALLLVLAGLAVFCFAGMHELAASAQKQGGFIGSFVSELKREDDQAEVRELREQAPKTPEEREAAREQREQAAIEAAAAREREEGSQTLAGTVSSGS